MTDRAAVAGPTLAEVLTRPETLHQLGVDTLLRLQQELGHLRVDIEAAVARHLVPRSQTLPVAPLVGSELTVADVAVRLRRPVGHVRALLRRKELPGYRRGKYWVIPETDLQTWQVSRMRLDGQCREALPSADRSGTGLDQLTPRGSRSSSRSIRDTRREVGGSIAGHPDHG